MSSRLRISYPKFGSHLEEPSGAHYTENLCVSIKYYICLCIHIGHHKIPWGEGYGRGHLLISSACLQVGFDLMVKESEERLLRERRKQTIMELASHKAAKTQDTFNAYIKTGETNVRIIDGGMICS